MLPFARFSVPVAIASFTLACGGGGGPPANAPEAPAPSGPQEGAHAGHGHHHHGGGHGPLVHAFNNASQWAKEFDNPERDAWQKPAEIVSLLTLKPGTRVADIGAGTGYFEPHLSRAVGPSGSVFALDVEDSMVAYLRERAARESLTNVTASKVEFEDPKLAKQSVDRVLIVNTWHHIAGREAYAKKIKEGLVSQGFVAIVDFTLEATHGPPKEHRLSPEQVKKELESAGFRVEIATETLPEQYVVIGHNPSP